jgi:hypothetical protein
MCSDGMAQIQREGCDPRQHLALSDQYPVWRCQLAEWLGGVAWRHIPRLLLRKSMLGDRFNTGSSCDEKLATGFCRSLFRGAPPDCSRTSPTESCQLNRVPMPPTPREISHPEPQCTPRFPGAASAARGHPGVSRIAPRAICASRSQFSCREPLRPPEVHVASWCGNNLTTPAVPQTCSPQLRHANSPSRTPLKP